jgi:hypothetical protein
MVAGLRSDQAAFREPQRYGIVGWLLKNDSREQILEVVARATQGAAAAQPGG